MLYQSQTLESSILYLFPWAFSGMGEYGAFRLLSDRASKNNEVLQLFSLLVVLFRFVLFLVGVRGFQGQVMETGCVSCGLRAACWGRTGETLPLWSSCLHPLRAQYFGKLQERLGLPLPK